MSTILKNEKLYKKITNKKLVEKFAHYILEQMSASEVKRYYNRFRHEMDFNIFQYGNLDIYDYDLYRTLYNLGLRTKPVMNYHNNLDTFPFPYRYREDVRKAYKYLVREAVLLLRDEGMLK